MAVAMRLGMNYCPDYGWGMNGQEAAWNPKHTLPDELKRIQRLCSQLQISPTVLHFVARCSGTVLL